MSMEKRIEKLEKHAEATKGKGPPIIYVLHGGEREPSQEEKDCATEEYVKKYGETPELAIIVPDESTKTLVERIMAGERIERSSTQ